MDSDTGSESELEVEKQRLLAMKQTARVEKVAQQVKATRKANKEKKLAESK
jgi:hypothetical protein